MPSTFKYIKPSNDYYLQSQLIQFITGRPSDKVTEKEIPTRNGNEIDILG